MNLLWAALTILLVFATGVLGLILIVGAVSLLLFSIMEYFEARVEKTTNRKHERKPEGKVKRTS
ncbi:MAG: hypothetical protein GTN74_13045 [Proteobacteria bacterium]|nr:hypothetical protein [Pseudomonadota bacterium]NIS71354.1 hypothetical protein [Pseudomonadota bacterium]